MSQAPLVSVVLPTYNRAHELARSAGSVLNQSFVDFELIIVDDGSQDDTAGAVEALADPRVRYVRKGKNAGVAAARNTGVEAARGRYLAFQDSDDEWLPGKLELQVADLKGTHDDAMSVCGLTRGSTEPGKVLYYPRSPAHWKNGLDHRGVLGSTLAYTQTWLVPRQQVLKAGGFDVRMRIWDDWDLLIRLSRDLALRTRVEPLVFSGRSADSLSLDVSRFAHDLGLILDKYADHLRRYPREQALMRFQHARWLARSGQRGPAQRELLRTIRTRPLWPAPWRLLARSLLAPSWSRRV